MSTVSLTDLQRQIAQRERELQALREELQTRQSQFTELTRRKEELQRQLLQVEEEIAAQSPPRHQQQSKQHKPLQLLIPRL
jgi:chromosome segregation ATPase